jgi:hypothetical protein
MANLLELAIECNDGDHAANLSPEEYRKRAKEARQQANTCRNEYERQGLLIIAEQCERIAAYKDLIGPDGLLAVSPRA